MDGAQRSSRDRDSLVEVAIAFALAKPPVFPFSAFLRAPMTAAEMEEFHPCNKKSFWNVVLLWGISAIASARGPFALRPFSTRSFAADFPVQVWRILPIHPLRRETWALSRDRQLTFSQADVERSPFPPFCFPLSRH